MIETKKVMDEELTQAIDNISNEIKKVTLTGGKFDIFIVVDELSFNHAKERKVANEIENFLNS